MKTRYKILLIAIPIALIVSSGYINAFLNFVADYDALDDTSYDLEVIFDAEEYSVEYFVVNGSTDYVEIDITCKDGLTIGYKKDLSKAICTTPETIYKLERRGWIISPTHSHHDPSMYENDIAVLCNSSDDILVSYGYSKRDDDIEAKVVSFERIQYDGHAGALLTFDRAFDGGMARGANNGYFPYIHCINESVDTFDKCMNVSHHYSNSNYPIVECLTLDGKKFSYDEALAMSKNSGIEIYTINHLSSHSLEFVGKTDQVDQMISFSIVAPNGDEISTWKELAPDEGEFRVAVTTGGPLWKQQDGTFTLVAKQVDVPYYEAFSEFELADGRIVR